MNRIIPFSIFTLGPILLLSSTTISQAADWPMYRASASRGGYTAESLPSGLTLRWSFQTAHKPQPAWPRSSRMPFDRAPHVVAAGGMVYFGTTQEGRVHALDAATGETRWTFPTDGPIRFAPAIAGDSLLVASDDGYLYALNAKTGSLRWKHRGGPQQASILGNQHIISKWPARGGPVVVGEVVYYAAGIWPSEGIYLYALKIKTGEVVWVNDDSGALYMAQPHGGANATSGISAQGYLVATEKNVFVPTGRAVPAAFDRATGKFKYFHLQQYGHKGGAPTMAIGDLFFNSGISFDSTSGKASGKSIGGGAIVATADGLVRAAGGKAFSYRWAEIKSRDRKGNQVTTRGLQPLATVENIATGPGLIVAGNKIICGGESEVTMIDRASNKIVWRAMVRGTAYGLAVANGQLLVSTDQGTVYAFDGNHGAVVHSHHPAIAANPFGENSRFAKAADKIIEKSKIKDGYCVDLGCGEGRLALELARRTNLHIYAVDEDENNCRIARAKLIEAGLYGIRVTVHHRPLDATGYPRYFADLVVSGRSITDENFKRPTGETARLQRPFGGVAISGSGETMKTDFRGALAGAGSWTHQYTDAANTLCSSDDLVKGPLGMLWFRDIDVKMPQRHGRGPAPLFHDGRLYSEGVDELLCVNAYNGRVIWRYPVPNILKAYDGDQLMGTAGTGSNYCIAGKSVYLRRDDHCLRIDAATGKLLGKFTAPKQKNGELSTWGYVACSDGILFGTLANRNHVVTYRFVERGGDMKKLLTESLTLFAMDAKSGKLLWRYDAKTSLRHNAIAIGGDVVYLIDRPLALFDQSKNKKTDKHPSGTLVALEAKTGKVRWQNDRDLFGTSLSLSTKHGLLLVSYQPTRFRLASEVGGRMAVFRTSDGHREWDKKVNYSSRPLINDYTVYAQGGAWDLVNGESRPFNFSRSYGCGILAGSKHMMLYRSATLGYFDLAKNKKTENYGGMRPGCWINALPVGGLVLVPDASAGCACSYLNRSWLALVPSGVRAPAITSSGDKKSGPISVTIAADNIKHQVHYTLDGSTPTRKSPRYSEPVVLKQSATLKARSFTGKEESRVESATFTIKVAAFPKPPSP